ncbi:MAG TPA: DUF3558 family protein [Candidatus Limnocylindria bacterium]|nr:DUF3558 family protein [Candidatus Limnocylindria bacterium]
MRTAHLRPLAALLLVAVVAACSTASGNPDDGGNGADASQPPISAESIAPSATPEEPEVVAGTELDACEIVTAEDVATATGLDVAEIGEGELEETPTILSPDHSDCDYRGDWGGVSISLTPEDGANLYDAARGSYDDASDREILGADGAFYSAGTNRAFFWKGAVTVMMQVGFLAEGGDVDAILTALGQAAIDKVD